MTVTCIYENCNASAEKNPELRFARFVQPRTDYERASRWVKLIGRPGFTIENIKYRTIICERHFPNGVNLNWRLNKTLEPYPSNVLSAVEDLDYFSPPESRPSNPKCYSSKRQPKDVAFSISYGFPIDNKDIDMSGNSVFFISFFGHLSRLCIFRSLLNSLEHT